MKFFDLDSLLCKIKMLKVFALFLFCASLAASHPANLPKISLRQPSRLGASRIVNGDPAEEGQFPWQVAVKIDKSYLCGGSLISNKWVLTAGHCVSSGKSFEILFGTLTLDSAEISLTSTDAFLHEDFDLSTIANDIALIKLPEDVTLTANIDVVTIAEEEPEDGVNATVSGWGDVDDGVASTALNYVTVTTMSNDDCKQTYGDVIRPEMLCTTSLTSEAQGTCLGDSGGPLVTDATTNPVLIGVVSFVAEDMCSMGYPSGFTRVATYNTWINDKIASEQ